MNHKANIKEMLNTQPTGYRSSAPNFTDSQFFFGTQFWRENSQSLSQDMNLSARNSQQSSQECSDPRISTRYQSKPLLFGDPKDNQAFLDAFEEAKKKAKEKSDSDMFAKECLQIRESLTTIQQLVSNTEEKASLCETILQKLSNLSSTLKNVSSIQSEHTQQFNAVLNTVNSQKEMMTELGQRVQKNGDSNTELAASMHSDVECLRQEQNQASLKQQSMLEEALQLLNALVSEHSGKLCPVQVTDKAMQTSPGQDKGVQTAQAQDSPNSPVSALDCPVRMRKKKPASRSRRRPLVRQRSKLTVANENSQPRVDSSKQPNVLRSLGDRPGPSKASSRGPEILLQPNAMSRSSKTAGCFITPLSCWSQESNSPERPQNMNPNSEVVLIESSPPDALWQLFEMD
ncbi:interactor of HORMAD1 protein 1 isoform X2 [Vanacampus margaritifer]